MGKLQKLIKDIVEVNDTLTELNGIVQKKLCVCVFNN